MHRLDVESPEQQAERAANENYRKLQAEVIGAVIRKLSSRKMRLDESDLEEAYCQAWHGVYETIKRGTPVSNLTGLLIEITWRRAVDIYRELRPGQRIDLEVGAPVPDLDVDVDEQLDDKIKLRRFIAQVRGRLNPRECEAVSLCVIHGYPRPEAAKLMGLQRRQMEKLMDGATKKIGGVIASISTRGCGGDEWARLMRSYALGLIAEDDRDYARAAEHVSQCAACRRYVNGLRGLAAILPPVLPFGPVADAGHGAGILAHLERFFRHHGHSGGMTGAGSALRTTGAGAAGSASGGGLVSSLSTGTIAKGVVVLAAGAAALALAAHGGKAHHVIARRASPPQAQSQIPASASASAAPLAAPSSSATALRQDSAGVRVRHSVVRRRAHVLAAKKRIREEPAPQGRSGIEDARYSSPEPSAPPTPREESANSAAVNREFGWEH